MVAAMALWCWRVARAGDAGWPGCGGRETPAREKKLKGEQGHEDAVEEDPVAEGGARHSGVMVLERPRRARARIFR